MKEYIKRCLWCGKRIEDNFGCFCDLDCEEKFNESSMNNLKKGLCSCGQPLYIHPKVGLMAVCKNCLEDNNKLCSSIDKISKKIKGDFQ